jgi:hypothetical protein
MINEIVYFPTTCPTCLRVTRVPYTRTEISFMTRLAVPVTLFSPCHNFSWTASKTDREDLRALAKQDLMPVTRYPQGRQSQVRESARSGSVDSATDWQRAFLPMPAAND